MTTEANKSTADRQTFNRRATLGALGVSCAAAGAWWALSHEANLALSDAPDPVAQFWGSAFATPQGGQLRTANFKGRPLVLNFWATWCPPCVEELPLLERFYVENKVNGWQVLGIAADQAKNVVDFLAKLPLSFSIALAGSDAIQLSKQLGNISGGLPYTVVFDGRGMVAQRKLGQVKPADIATWTSIR